jgi:hypothetical protein
MKKSITILLLSAFMICGTSEIQAQDESFTPMWESFYITPDNTKLKALSEAMAKHNKKYHNEGPYQATVYSVVSGPNMGKMVWQMGPLKFSHLDSRPSADGHDEDWRDNVMPNVKKLSHGEYWKQDMEASNTDMMDGDVSSTPILHIRFHEVSKDGGYNVDHLLNLISGTIKAMDGSNPWGVYDNQFRQGYDIGRHLATVRFLKNYAEYDKPNTFKDTFIKKYGEESWQPFIEGMSHAMSNSWDEVWEYSPALSGN